MKHETFYLYLTMSADLVSRTDFDLDAAGVRLVHTAPALVTSCI